MWHSPADLLLPRQDDGLGRPVDPEDARQRADDILGRAEYQEPGESIFDRALDWLGDQLSRLFFEGGGGIADLVAYAIVFAALGLVIWVVVKLVRAPGAVAVDTDDDGVTYGTESIRRPSVWLDEAARLAVAGDFRGALRCRHQALVATWITTDVIDHVAGRTAAECHAAAGVQAQEPSRHVVDTFEAVWYGTADVDATGYETFAAACARLEGIGSGSRRRVAVAT